MKLFCIIQTMKPQFLKLIIVLIIILPIKLSAQYYAQVIQTPILLHPSYAGRDTFSVSIVEQNIRHNRDIHMGHTRFLTKYEINNLLVTFDGMIKNTSWSWGGFVAYENNYSEHLHSLDSSMVVPQSEDSVHYYRTGKDFIFSAFTGKNFISRSGRLTSNISLGFDYSYGAGRNQKNGWEASEIYRQNQGPLIIKNPFNIVEKYNTNSPVIWAAFSLRTPRFMAGLKAGIGKDFVNIEHYDHHNNYLLYKGRDKLSERGLEAYLAYNVVIEASFPKKKDSFFSFRPVIALNEAVSSNRNYYGFNSKVHAYWLNHISANFRLWRIPFGIGLTNDYYNYYAGYAFKKFSVIAGLSIGNYSIGLRSSF